MQEFTKESFDMLLENPIGMTLNDGSGNHYQVLNIIASTIHPESDAGFSGYEIVAVVEKDGAKYVGWISDRSEHIEDSSFENFKARNDFEIDLDYPAVEIVGVEIAEGQKETFAVGDKVYYPLNGAKIYTLIDSGISDGNFPLEISGVTTFTTDGKLLLTDRVPALFKATEENHELLTKLYGLNFEKPKSVLLQMLKEGKNVLCVCSDFENPFKWIDHILDIPDHCSAQLCVVENFVKEKTFPFVTTCGLHFKFAKPCRIDEFGNLEFLE